MNLKFNKILVLLIVLVTHISFGQERVVSGVVSDNSGLPIPDVIVTVKGTKTSTATNIDGKYSIKAAPSQTLVFSFIGMKTQEIVASSASISPKMTSDSVQLESVVVTSFGIKRQQKALGYATTTLTSKDLTQVNNTTLFESLSGKVAGVDITAPAQIGASSKVVIRGFSDFGDSTPLYVVDGTPINNNTSSSATGNTRSFDAGNAANDLDPNNIESMTILKGAAASALYGSRGSKGVIVITTKSGKKKGKITVEITSSADMSQVARVPHFQTDFGQGWNAHSYDTYNPGTSQDGNNASNQNGSWGPAFNGEIRPWGTIYNNSQQIKPYVALKNNIRDFYTQGSTFTNNARVSGGGENSNFSLSFGDVNSDGVIPTNADAYRRRTFGFNGGISNKKLSITASANYVKKDQNAVNTGQGSASSQGATLTQEILQTPTDVSIVDMADYKNNPFNTNDYFYTPYASNPYWVINENSTYIDGNRFYGNTNIAYNFTDKLSLSYQVGGDYQLEKVKSYGAIVNYAENTPQSEAGTIPVVGGVTEISNEFVQFDSNLILHYNTKIDQDFNLVSFAGFGDNELKNSSLQASITNLDIPNFYELSNSAVKPQVAQDNYHLRNYALFGSLETSYKDRVYLTLTGRNEWNSSLPEANNSYFYYSGSISGIVLNTHDYFLKLRAGYGKVATGTGAYQTFNSLTQGVANLGFGSINLPIGGVNGYENIATLGNPNLKPQFVTEKEIGFETNLFNKRVNMDFSYYDKKTDGLIITQPLPPTTGYTRRTANSIDLRNRGVEIMLNLVPVKTTNFQWDFTTTFSKNESKVLDVVGDTNKILLAQNYGVSYNAIVGQPLGVFSTFVPLQVGYSTDANGNFHNGTGSYIVDANGYYKVTPDEQNIGTSQRKFVMGFMNKFTYKNFALNFGIDWKEGGKMYSYTKRLAQFVGNGKETTYNDRNPFIIPNSVVENSDGTYSENTTAITQDGVTDFYNTQNNPGYEQNHVIDKTFVRLRDVGLTYNLPSKLIRNTGLTAVSFTVYGKNLALWTPKDNSYIDPELSTFGTGLLSEQGEFGANPSQRTYGGTLKLIF